MAKQKQDDATRRNLEFEYAGWQAARQADLEQHGVARDKDLTFTQFVKARDANQPKPKGK